MNRHKVALRKLGQLEVRQHEAGGERRFPGGHDQAGGRRGGGSRQQGLGRRDSHEGRPGEEQGQGVTVVRRGQRDASIGRAARKAEVGLRKDAAVRRKMSQWEEEMERKLPGSPDAEGVKDTAKGGRERPGRGTPVERLHRERDQGERKGGPGFRSNHHGQVRVEELSLLGGPPPAWLEEIESVGKKGPYPGKKDQASSGGA